MKNKISLLLVCLLVLGSASVTVYADTTIQVAGSVIYSQDFEGTVEDALTNSTNNFSVIERDGNKMLLVNGYGATKLGGWFGPQVADSIIKADVMQIAANSPNGTYLAFGLRGDGVGTPTRNFVGYSDIMRYNFDTNSFDATAASVRDRLFIGAASAGTDYSRESFQMKRMSQNELGILDTTQFDLFDGKYYERNFNNKFYRMTGTAVGTATTGKIQELSGTVIDSLSCNTSEYAAVRTTGYFNIFYHSTVAYVDNIKVMTPVNITSFSASPTYNKIGVGESTDLNIIANTGTVIQADTARFVYDDTKVKIDFAANKIIPLQEGEHTVTVYLDDINGNGSLSNSFTITGAKTLEVNLENNMEIGDTAILTVLYEGAEVVDYTVSASDGLSYANGIISAVTEGLKYVNITYQGQTTTVPVAVNDNSKNSYIRSSSPVFQSDFSEGTAEATFVTGAVKTTGTATIALGTDNNNAVLQITSPSGVIRTPQFGPTLSNYSIEYDFKVFGEGGNYARTLGATMRADSGNLGYRFPFASLAKYNTADFKLGTGSVGTRQTTSIGKSNSDESVNLGYYTGLGNSFGTGNTDTTQYYHMVSTIVGDTLSNKVSDSAGTLKSSYTTTMSAVNLYDNTMLSSGRTAISSRGMSANIDNLKIYSYDAVSDIAVSHSEPQTLTATPFTVSGIIAENQTLALDTSAISVKTMGNVSATNQSFTPLGGIGYVCVTYKDNANITKNKIIKVNTPYSEQLNVEKFAFVNPKGESVGTLTAGGGAFVDAVLLRGQAGSDAPQLILAIYTTEAGVPVLLNTVKIAAATASQTVGDRIRLQAKTSLPESLSNVLVKAFLLKNDGSLIPIANSIEVN